MERQSELEDRLKKPQQSQVEVESLAAQALREAEAVRALQKKREHVDELSTQVPDPELGGSAGGEEQPDLKKPRVLESEATELEEELTASQEEDLRELDRLRREEEALAARVAARKQAYLEEKRRLQLKFEEQRKRQLQEEQARAEQKRKEAEEQALAEQRRKEAEEQARAEKARAEEEKRRKLEQKLKEREELRKKLAEARSRTCALKRKLELQVSDTDPAAKPVPEGETPTASKSAPPKPAPRPELRRAGPVQEETSSSKTESPRAEPSLSSWETPASLPKAAPTTDQPPPAAANHDQDEVEKARRLKEQEKAQRMKEEDSCAKIYESLQVNLQFLFQ